MPVDVEFLVSGGGIAGKVATLVLARAGFSVALVDVSGPVSDPRTTAFLQKSQALLDDTGLWNDLAPHAMPLWKMAIADLDRAGVLRRHKTFDAADISDRPFGWNLPNDAIHLCLDAALTASETVAWHRGVATQSMMARDQEAHVRLSDGSRIRAACVVAADGRGSPLREAAGIGVKTWRYGQKALVFTVTHECDHENTSTEIHRDGGPFTLVPLPPEAGQSRSSVVWMEKGAEAGRLKHLPAHEFEAAVNERSGGLLGNMRIETPPKTFPIISQRSERLTDQRLVLVAEAAHVVPPIGAQGLNMSLSDIRTLRDFALSNRGDMGSMRMLDAYAKARGKEISARVAAIDALNRASIAGAPALRDIRSELIAVIHDVIPVRHSLMRAGLS